MVTQAEQSLKNAIEFIRKTMGAPDCRPCARRYDACMIALRVALNELRLNIESFDSLLALLDRMSRRHYSDQPDIVVDGDAGETIQEAIDGYQLDAEKAKPMMSVGGVVKNDVCEGAGKAAGPPVRNTPQRERARNSASKKRAKSRTAK